MILEKEPKIKAKFQSNVLVWVHLIKFTFSHFWLVVNVSFCTHQCPYLQISNLITSLCTVQLHNYLQMSSFPVGFIEIQTQIVGVEANHADHLTTTTTQKNSSFVRKDQKINEKEAKDCTYFKFLTKWPATKLPGVDKRIKWSTRADRMRENATTQIASKRKIKNTLKRKNALSTREKRLRSRLLNAF